jgi:hypothetical protein
MLNNRTTATSEANMRHHDNIENGDLSSWEYLTSTFDSEQIFTESNDLIFLPEKVVDQKYDARPAHIGDSSKSGNNSRERRTYSSSSPDLLRVNQLFHRSFGNCESLPASAQSDSKIEQKQIHPMSKRVRSWSHPIILDHAEISSNHTIAQQTGNESLNNRPDALNNNLDHRNRWPENSFGTSDRFKRGYSRFDDNTIKFQSSEQSMPHHSFVTPSHRNHSSDTTTIERLTPQDTSYFDATSTAVSLTEIVAQMNYFPNVDSQLGRAYHTSTASKKLKHTPHEQNPGDSMLEMYKQTPMTRVDSFSTFNRSTVSAIAPSKSAAACFSPTEHETISSWINLHISTVILPYQRFLCKKLLLPPLTPYNYFFRDERENIVSHISSEKDPLPPPLSEVSVSKLQHLLNQRWFFDPLKKKRQHRKIHGKINFQRLSKVIAERWHQLPKRVREFYREVARYDDIYYHQQLEVIKQRPDIT